MAKKATSSIGIDKIRPSESEADLVGRNSELIRQWTILQRIGTTRGQTIPKLADRTPHAKHDVQGPPASHADETPPSACVLHVSNPFPPSSESKSAPPKSVSSPSPPDRTSTPL